MAAVAAVAVIWLPFAYGVSPGETIGDLQLRYLAAPFLLASRSPRVMRGGCGRPAFPQGRPGLAASCRARSRGRRSLLREVNSDGGPDPAEPRDWITLALPVAFLTAWAVLMVRPTALIDV